MNQDVARILSLKRILESVAQGSGISRSAVQELRGTDRLGKEAARGLLLGYPVPLAMRPMMDHGAAEVAMLASLVAAAPGSSAPAVGRRGSAVARTLERWVKAKEARALEQKVMRFRSLVTSGVLGAVTGMVATLGPMVGSLGFGGGQGPGGGALVYGAAAMTAVSSGLLGAFMSGRGLYVNVALSLATFGLVCAVASPLATVTSVSLWGVK
jgi:hypothetical protein